MTPDEFRSRMQTIANGGNYDNEQAHEVVRMKRPCLDCPTLTTTSRCPIHTKQHQRERDARRAQADPQHRQRHRLARWAWTNAVATGTITCYRADTEPNCPGLIAPGTAWDIDETPTGWHPSHASCNRAAGARSRKS